jgi:hypothetical protein
LKDFHQDTNIHFVCFVQKNGILYELDGRREFPQNRGECQPEEVLKVRFSSFDFLEEIC